MIVTIQTWHGGSRLDQPVIVYSEYWGEWSVDAGYYGVAVTDQPAWTLDAITPNSEESARTLAARHAEITALIADTAEPAPAGVVALIFPIHYPARQRLRAAQTPDGGWVISNYDYPDAWAARLLPAQTPTQEP